MLDAVNVSPGKPATSSNAGFGRRALTMTRLIVLVAVVGVATAAVLAAIVGGLLVAARELQ